MDALTFTFKQDGNIPLYHQLYEFIKMEIQMGRISHNEKLPSKRKLSAHLNISQNTIQTAYSQLIEEGYIISIEKSGFYVSKIENIVKLEDIKEINPNDYKSPEYDVKYDFSMMVLMQNPFRFQFGEGLLRKSSMSMIKKCLKLKIHRAIYGYVEVL